MAGVHRSETSYGLELFAILFAGLLVYSGGLVLVAVVRFLGRLLSYSAAWP